MTRPRRPKATAKDKDVGQASGGVVSAETILREAAETIERRAPLRDKHGFRANALAALAFNALRGTELTEEDVCVLLAVVKLARAAHGNDLDNYRDLAGYAALAAEASQRFHK